MAAPSVPLFTFTLVLSLDVIERPSVPPVPTIQALTTAERVTLLRGKHFNLFVLRRDSERASNSSAPISPVR